MIFGHFDPSLWCHRGRQFRSKYTIICVFPFLTDLPSFIKIGWKMSELGPKNSFWVFSTPWWRHRGGQFRPKCTKICVTLFSTLLPSFIEIGKKNNRVEIGWKMIEFSQKKWFSDILTPHYDVIKESEFSQKSPKFVFFHSQHFCQVLLRLVEKWSISVKISDFRTFWPPIMTS